MKIIILMLIFCMISFRHVNGQPYTYSTSVSKDTGSEAIFTINRFNLNSNQVEQFTDYYGESPSLLWDPSETYLVIKNSYSPSIILNVRDTSKYLVLPSSAGAMGKILYDHGGNSLYIFYSAVDSLNENISSINLSNGEIKSTIAIPYLNTVQNDLGSEAFFSSDSNRIYFASLDTNSDKSQIWSYSTESSEITSKKTLSSLGYPNANGYLLTTGERGVGVITSYFNQNTQDSYYTIYNFDTDSSLSTIHVTGFATPIMCFHNKYLALEETTFDSLNQTIENTGDIKFYDVASGKLVKDVTLPPSGKAYYFINFPSKLYYVLSDSSQVSPIDLETLSSNMNLVVKLENSASRLLTGGTLQYYDGSWKDATNNGDGTFAINTTKSTLSLRMTYAYGSETVNNVPAQNNTYIFQTKNVAVQLSNSLGNLIDTGAVQYYAGAWRDFGTTTNGVANKELLPNNYSFRMTYANASIDKQQDVGPNPTVVFQTVKATIQLQNSQGNLIDQGTAQYYAGAWRDIGSTSNGKVSIELLPKSYSFRMTYNSVTQNKSQDISTNNIVQFNTGTP